MSVTSLLDLGLGRILALFCIEALVAGDIYTPTPGRKSAFMVTVPTYGGRMAAISTRRHFYSQDNVTERLDIVEHPNNGSIFIDGVELYFLLWIRLFPYKGPEFYTV